MPAFLANPLIVYAFTLFTSAFLLFLVQPMLGKMILPKFGGTPQVWSTTMLFFQATLLAGYFYPHWVNTRLPLRRQIYFHTFVVALPLIAFVFFPLGIAYKYEYVDPPGEGNAALWVLLILAMLIGAPFLVVSTSAPLLQRWFSHSGHEQARDPYFLYAASNVGSLLALFSYPFLVEPYLTVPAQGIAWMIGYCCLLGFTVYCGYMVRQMAPPDPVPAEEDAREKAASSEQITEKRPIVETIREKPADGSGDGAPAADASPGGDDSAADDKVETAVAEKPAAVSLKGAKRWRKREKAKAETSEAITRQPTAPVSLTLDKKAKTADLPELAGQPTVLQQARWVALAFVPSSLMLGVTMYLTTDIAAIPLLWIIPLALYLISFILVFSRLPNWVHQAMVLSLPVSVLLLAFVIISDINMSFWKIQPIMIKFFINLLNLFIVAMVCHGELARSRPAPRYLTKFFLLMSIGGMLGGLFNGLLATVIFNSVAEYQLVLAVACMMLPPLEVDLKSTINRWVDNGLAIGLGVAGLYVIWRWAKLIRESAQENDPIKITSFLTLPGVNPGWLSDFIAAIIILALAAYVFHKRDRLLPRLLDVILPLSLFLLTCELIRASPFNQWDFGRLAKLFGQDNAWIARLFTFGLPIALCYGFAEQPFRFGLGVGAILLAGLFHSTQEYTVHGPWYTKILHQERTFFGVLKVEERGHIRGPLFSTPERRLLHGTTLHGTQNLDSTEALTYYHRTGPVGLAYQAMFSGDHAKDPVAFIGLGTGTMASYCNVGQTVTFYEIDHAVVKIAEDPRYFTYLQECKKKGGNYEFQMGDARLRLKDAPDHTYRMIVVDAFTSDAIPVHLITKEAIELYFDKLTEEGIAAIHISNRHLQLGPVLARIAEKLDLAAVRLYDGEMDLSGGSRETNPAGVFPGKNTSDWVVMARKPKYLQPLRLFDRLTSFNKPDYLVNEVGVLFQPGYVPILVGNGRWEPLETKPEVGLWTDDFSNILSIFNK